LGFQLKKRINNRLFQPGQEIAFIPEDGLEITKALKNIFTTTNNIHTYEMIPDSCLHSIVSFVMVDRDKCHYGRGTASSIIFMNANIFHNSECIRSSRVCSMEIVDLELMQKEGEGGSRGAVKSASRTLDILELLAGFPNGLSLTDIGHSLKIPLSSQHVLIKSLLSRGYLIRTEGTLLYRLGPRVVKIAAAYKEHSSLISIVDPVISRIRDITTETTSLSLLQGNMIIFVHKRIASGVVQVVNPVGTQRHAHATGSGKVMLSRLAREEIDRIYPVEALPALTPHTISSKTALLAALEEIRRNQYAFDLEESDIGLWAVAGCIMNSAGQPIAAISIAAPYVRIQSKDYKTWHRLVREGAAEVSSLLSYNP
jgi:IclR family transcriptional regulator, KDG regulon repressor